MVNLVMILLTIVRTITKILTDLQYGRGGLQRRVMSSSGNSGDDDDDIDKRWKGTLSLVTRLTWGAGVKFNISTLPIRANTFKGHKVTFLW